MDGRHRQLHQGVSFLFEQLEHNGLPCVCSVSVLVVLWSRLWVLVEVGDFCRRELVQDGFAWSRRLPKQLGDFLNAEVLLVCVNLLLGQMARDDGV